MITSAQRLVATLSSIVLFVACGGEEDFSQYGSKAPKVQALDSNRLTLGQTVHFLGDNFIDPSKGHTKLRFEGMFYFTDAAGNQVAERVEPFTIVPVNDGVVEGKEFNGVPVDTGTQILRWNRFGPFKNPFLSSGLETGTFKGTVQAINVSNDGGVDCIDPNDPGCDSTPTEVAVNVGNSIAITRLEPIIDEEDMVTADCGNGAIRAIGGMRYVLEVEALGIEPEFIVYEFSGINGTRTVTTFTHNVYGNTSDQVGADANERIVFDQVPDDFDFSVGVVRVTAIDGNNNIAETVLPISVVRPLQTFYDGNRDLAELYQPVAVHGPIIGTVSSGIGYSESSSESRQQGVSQNFSHSFSESTGISFSENTSNTVGQSFSESTSESTSESESESESRSESNTTSEGLSTTDGWNFGGSAGIGLGEFGSGIFLGASPKFSVNGGINHSSTTNESSSETISNTWGVGKQSSISKSSSESESNSNSMTVSTGTSNSSNVSIGDSESWGNTWSDSSSSTTALGFSASLPAGRCAMIYRQTERFTRTAQVFSYDMCGVRSTVGEMTFNEWSWAPNIAIGDDCSGGSVPTSTLPTAQCFSSCQ
jgi:hypothetical protein